MAKTEEKEPEFTILVSDGKLKEKVNSLVLEDESDKRAIDLIMQQGTLCKSQRDWISTLLARGGKKFDVKNIVKKK